MMVPLTVVWLFASLTTTSDRCTPVVERYQQDFQKLQNSYGDVRFSTMKILYESTLDIEVMFAHCFRWGRGKALQSQRRRFTQKNRKLLESYPLYQQAFQQTQRERHVRTMMWGGLLLGIPYLSYSLAMGIELPNTIDPVSFRVRSMGFIPVAGPFIHGIHLFLEAGATRSHALIGTGILHLLVGVLQVAGFAAILSGYVQLSRLNSAVASWPPRKVTLAPWVTPEGAGLQVLGRF
ncbi:MAG: hypothetical protein EP343_08925 [Deltaproteobacteria bacterium]|nr:MAG: hypothetical protein EP343_08925 [Deltaproteobacteria bacterium]